MNQLDTLWNAETERWNRFYYSQDDCYEEEREVPDWVEEDDYEDSF